MQTEAPTEKPLSRQRQWQLRRVAAGQCTLCGQPLSPTSRWFCAKHHEDSRNRSLRSGRLKAGKNLDEPIIKGCRRGQNPLASQPNALKEGENAFQSLSTQGLQGGMGDDGKMLSRSECLQ